MMLYIVPAICLLKKLVIYIFADAPHLMKTSRNCVYHSGAGNYTRHLWNNGKCIMWDHTRKLLYDDINRVLKRVLTLTLDHTELNPFSKMKVSYATQVLSFRVSKILKKYYPGAEATAEFCEYFDSFFDCVNVRNKDEGNFKRKEFLAPSGSGLY